MVGIASLGRCPPPQRGRTGAGQGLGQLQRMFEGLSYRVGRVQQHAGQPDLLGMVDRHAGADDDLDAIGAHVRDAVARVLAGDEAAMLDVQPEAVLETAEGRHIGGMGDQADPGGDPACARQRFHQVEPVGLDRDQRHLQPAAQVGRIRAAGDHHVAVFAAQALADHIHRLLEAEVDGHDAGAAVELRDHIAEQAGQARHADRPDHRQLAGLRIRQAGAVAGQADRHGRVSVFQFQPCYRCFNVSR